LLSIVVVARIAVHLTRAVASTRAGGSAALALFAFQHRYVYIGADLQDLFGVRPATLTTAGKLQTDSSKAAAPPT
jgi:putative ABC transport system permease protein